MPKRSRALQIKIIHANQTDFVDRSCIPNIIKSLDDNEASWIDTTGTIFIARDATTVPVDRLTNGKVTVMRGRDNLMWDGFVWVATDKVLGRVYAKDQRRLSALVEKVLATKRRLSSHSEVDHIWNERRK
jgi:hypothetical protein